MILRQKIENRTKELSMLNQKLEDDFKESERLKKRLGLALQGNNDGIWDWNLLDNSVYFSPRWKEMLGYSDNELANDFSSWEDNCHPDDLETIMEGIQENIDGKTEYFEGVHRLKHKDGHWIWILDRGKTIFDDNSKAVRMIGTHTDITEDHKTQEELQRFQAVLQNAPISIVMTDLDGTIEYVNPWFTKITGYTFEEAMGNNPKILKQIIIQQKIMMNFGKQFQVIKHGQVYLKIKIKLEIIIGSLQLSHLFMIPKEKWLVM